MWPTSNSLRTSNSSVNGGSPTIAPTDSGVMKLLRGGRHDRAHRDAALAQPPDQIERLVGRNAAADDQQHALCRRALGRAARGFIRHGRSGERIVLGRGAAQDGAHLVLDRAAVAGRAQPQTLLELVVELPDGE